MNDGYPIDFDSDGDPDIVLAPLATPTFPPSAVPLRAFRNNGTGGFTEATADVLGTVLVVHARDFRTADFNADGRMDLFVADHGTDVAPFPGGQSRILVQSVDGRLVDETSIRLPIIDAFTHHLSVGDIDSDGDPDIYMCNIWNQTQIGPRFYVNNGTGIFTADTSRLPLAITTLQRKFTASMFVDVDLDGDLDLVLGAHDATAPEGERDSILLNDGSGVFTFAPTTTMPQRSGGVTWETVDIASGDLDADGWPDLLMSVTLGYRQPLLQLLLNNMDGTFRDASANVPQPWPAPTPNPGPNWLPWIRPADLDHDGLLDIVTTTFGVRATLLVNQGSAVFTDHSGLLPDTATQIALAHDFTGDGKADVYLLNRPLQQVVAPNTSPDPGLLQNGDFGGGTGADGFPSNWLRFSLPTPNDIEWTLAGEALGFRRPPGSTQAVVFQQTGLTVPANAALEAAFRMANSDVMRRRFSVLIHDSDFTDLHVCTFWLPASSPSRTFVVRSHATKAWTNATLSIYAASVASGGFYELDDVALRFKPTQSAAATECVYPLAPTAGSSVPGNMLTNGDFTAGLAPWGLVGNIASQIAGGVFEFYKLAGSPSGVVLQSTGQPVLAGQALRLTMRLGNASLVRQRVTFLVHKEDFTDLHACTFWVPAGRPLRTFELRTYATVGWNNATVSVYPATVGSGPAYQWLQIDDVSLSRVSGPVMGSQCLEPGDASNFPR